MALNENFSKEELYASTNVQSSAISKNVFDEAFSIVAENSTSSYFELPNSVNFPMDYCPSLFRHTKTELREIFETMLKRPEDEKSGYFRGFDWHCRATYECDLRKTKLNQIAQMRYFIDFYSHANANALLVCNAQKKENDLISRPSNVRCKKHQRFFDEHYNNMMNFRKDFGTEAVPCIEYELAKSKPKIYQIFGLPFNFNVSERFIIQPKQILIQIIIRLIGGKNIFIF